MRQLVEARDVHGTCSRTVAIESSSERGSSAGPGGGAGRDTTHGGGCGLLDTLDWHSSARAPEAASLAIQCRAVGYARSHSRMRRHRSVAGGATQCRAAPVWLALTRSSRRTPGQTDAAYRTHRIPPNPAMKGIEAESAVRIRAYRERTFGQDFAWRPYPGCRPLDNDSQCRRALQSDLAPSTLGGGTSLTVSTESLSAFTDAVDPSDQRHALVDLVKRRLIHEVASDELFVKGLERLAHSVRKASSGTERLLTVAALLRAAAAARTVRPRVEALLTDAVVEPLSKLHELADVRDRLYAAKAWRAVPIAWSVDELAEAAAREGSGEAVRKECIEGVFDRANRFDEAIAALTKALLAVTFKTKRPGDSLGRRLNRVLAASTDAISSSHKPVGQKAGREISRLLEVGFRATGLPESTKVQIAVVEHVAVMTHAIVRADFSYGGWAETYLPLSVVQRWFHAHDWREICESSDAVARVRDDVRKALTLLAGAGKTDDPLRASLATAAGSREEADSICRRVATEHPGIPDGIRDWLAGASKRMQSASAVESQERAIDEVLAELLLEMTRLSAASEIVKSDVLQDVSIVLPQYMRALSRLTGMADAMTSKLNLAVKWRSLRIRGTVGEEVEYSPVEHQVSSGGVPARQVRLLSPVVERISEDGVPRVVLKAAVEPNPDQRELDSGASA